MPVYPFTRFLDKTVTVQRKTEAVDAYGGKVPTWADIAAATNVKAGKWQKRRNDAEANISPRVDGVSEIEWAFEPDLSGVIRRGDRISYGGEYYAIVGIPFDYSNDGLAAGPFIVKTINVKGA